MFIWTNITYTKYLYIPIQNENVTAFLPFCIKIILNKQGKNESDTKTMPWQIWFLSSMIERLHSIPENHIILSYTEESFYSFFLFSSNYFVSLMNPLIVSIVVWYFVIDILHAVFCNKIDICLLFDLEPCNIFATWMFGV